MLIHSQAENLRSRFNGVLGVRQNLNGFFGLCMKSDLHSTNPFTSGALHVCALSAIGIGQKQREKREKKTQKKVYETTKAIYILFTRCARFCPLWIGFVFFPLVFTFDSLRKRTAWRCLPRTFAVAVWGVCVCARTVVGFNFIFLTSFGVSAKLFGIASTLYIHLHKQRQQLQAQKSTL